MQYGDLSQSSRSDTVLSIPDMAKTLRLSDVQWDSEGRHLVWLEGRSDRGVLVAVSMAKAGHWDLTREISVRATVGYGGGDFATAGDRIWYVSGNQLYTQRLSSVRSQTVETGTDNLASPSVSPDGKWLALIHSDGEKDSIVLGSSAASGQKLVLNSSFDFYMQPCWHPSGQYLSWVSWNHPDMPWDNTQIVVARIQPESNHARLKTIETFMEGRGSACCQPTFSPDGTLFAFISDLGGWFNLEVRRWPGGQLVARVEDSAEHAEPAWVHGMRSYGWSPNSKSLYFLRSKEGFISLARLNLVNSKKTLLDGAIEEFTSLKQISVSPVDERVALIASSSHCADRVVVREPDGSLETIRKSLPDPSPAIRLSSAKSIAVKKNGREFYGLLYSPAVHPPFPLILKVHGGPTSQYRAEYDQDTQFFTSRGFAVFALNYRGSSGYGSQFRRALKERWGEADVEDLKDAAEFLVDRGIADSRHLVASGGSAGGLTVLMGLIHYPGLFRAAICRYGVTDLLTLDNETHKFESHYLERLIGRLPQHKERYRQRSPLTQVDLIRDPVAIFQGADDKVVPRSQAELLVQSLVARGVPHHYRVFQGEGHGWKRQSTICEYYADVESFLSRYVLDDWIPVVPS